MSARTRRHAVAAAIAALLLAGAISLPALGGPGRPHASAGDPARALRLAQAADRRSRRAAKLVAAAVRVGPRGPQGPQGLNGPNGPNGINGPNGANGANGANGTAGSAGAAGHAVRATIAATGPVTTTGTPQDLGSGGTYTQRAGEWSLVVATADGTTGSTCTNDPSGGGLQVTVLVDGNPVISGYLPWSNFQPFGGPTGAVDFTDASMQSGLVAPPSSATTRTVTVQVSDTCGGDGSNSDSFTVDDVRVTIAGTG